MCTLLKYVKMQQYAKYAAIVYLHKTDMPNSYTAHVHEMCQCVEIYVHANSSSVYYVETFVLHRSPTSCILYIMLVNN